MEDHLQNAGSVGMNAALVRILCKTREVWFESRSERSRRDPGHPGAPNQPPEGRNHQAVQVDQKDARVRS